MPVASSNNVPPSSIESIEPSIACPSMPLPQAIARPPAPSVRYPAPPELFQTVRSMLLWLKSSSMMVAVDGGGNKDGRRGRTV